MPPVQAFRGMGGLKVDARDHESRLDPGDIHRLIPDGAQPEIIARLPEAVPEGQGIAPRRPKLVSEIAGEPGARDHQPRLHLGQIEGAQICHIEPRRAQHRKGGRPLQGQPGNLSALVKNVCVKAPCRLQQPCQHRLLTAQPPILRPKVKERAIVDHHPLFVAPERIADPACRNFGHVAGDETVEHARRVRPGDAVFVHRRDIKERGLIAQGEIFELDRVEHGRGRISGPAIPALRPVERGKARMHRPVDQAQLGIGGDAHGVPLRAACAALRPASPIRSPPGWAEAPQRKSPDGPIP